MMVLYCTTKQILFTLSEDPRRKDSKLKLFEIFLKLLKSFGKKADKHKNQYTMSFF
jgi:hypothetical protein